MSNSFELGALKLVSEAWQTQRAERDWLRGVVEAAAPLLAPELGMVGAIARAAWASPADLNIVPYAHDLRADLFSVMDQLVGFARSTSEMRRNFASHAPVMTFSDFSCYGKLLEILAPAEVRDVAVMFMGQVFGHSLALAAVYRERHYFTPHQKDALVAAATQLGLAFNAHRFAQAPPGERQPLSKVLQPNQASVELRCAELLALGLETKEIARTLDISPDAARKHISNSMKRHGVQTRDELVRLISGGSLRLAG